MRFVRNDRGAAGVEIAGVTILVAAFFAAALTTVALGAPSVLGQEVSASICRAWNTLPGIDVGACATGDDQGGDELSGDPDEEPAYEDREWTYEHITDGPMVFIGDSYGSGEGAKNYHEETDRPGPSWYNPWSWDNEENKCHRSDNAWGVGIGEEHWPGNYDFNACSGATTRDVTNPNEGNHGEGPQIEDVTEDTSMIFVSMGGNDAQFSTFLKECLAANFVNGQTLGRSRGMAPQSAMIYCSDYFNAPEPDDPQGRTRMEVILDQVEANLAQMYQDLRDASGDNAHIVQMGYPQLFDPSYIGLIDPKDRDFLNAMADELNARMARVARENGIHFIDPTEAFAGHGVGSDDPWILGLGVWSEHRALPPESYHPNAEGQAAMQRLIEEYLASLP